ncbi:ferrous iron uptake protein feoa [Heliomicrobium modesticaldum Ice1]|uniref:Ferrous iron uptake protein feoa n=1 Tax=Heliobacterium modesticaldum (strain ATCC 51547 / Ice1) TaxID=498761 RepID=B0TDP7_HELMI|nr:FeoA family protein [Heliomicrobium modesticaldum]ABZ85572.1 ferrous iron uptake protein feoa [Heliomicrobium modesticaldum Ice1]
MRSPLSMVNRGRQVIIHQVEGCRKTKRHLEEMGFLPGTIVAVCQTSGGPMVVEVRGSKVMLGKSLAENIKVIHCCEREVGR